MVPMLQCGLLRSNFSLAIFLAPGPQNPTKNGGAFYWLNFWGGVEGARESSLLFFSCTLSRGKSLRVLLDHFVGDVLRHRLVVIVDHAELGAALGHAPQRVHIAEHV